MPHSRRDFLKRTAGVGLAAATLPMLEPNSSKAVYAASEILGGKTPVLSASDELFWSTVRSAFNLSPRHINLENGWYSPQFAAGIDEVCTQARMMNEVASFYFRGQWPEDLEMTHVQMARFADCPREEILITRNTTEALNIVIMGLDLKAGDEAIWGRYEYIRAPFEQRAARDGIVNIALDIPLTSMGDDEIVDAYKKAITARTKVIMVSHMVYLTGQVLPVRRICDMAHERGIEVIVDAAHAFAHITDKITDLHGDYYAASLHKWLLAPLGTGLLYVKKEKIEKLWPLFGDHAYASDQIQKFGHIGTHPAYVLFGIAEALRFNQAIGLERKAARLRYIKNYWVDRLVDVPQITVYTPREDHRACAISIVGIEGWDPGDLAKALYQRYQIFTVAPGYPGAIRISPNIYTSTDELDHFVAAMKELAAES